MATQNAWDVFRNEGRIGVGDWDAFPLDRLQDVYAAAAQWKTALHDVQRPWLCWSVDPDWCFVQQQLVSHVGWTPIVGVDGMGKTPPLWGGAVFIDFNKGLNLPGMWMHFVLEFVHLFVAQRFAFWHSDVLIPLNEMRALSRQFESVADGTLIATPRRFGPRYKLHRLLKGKRIFGIDGWAEFLGCTTPGASLSQFERGCGWWRSLEAHPNASPAVTRKRPHWEHGVGIRFWEDLYAGKVVPACVDVAPYHYSKAGHAVDRYRQQLHGSKPVNSKAHELRESFDLTQIVGGLGCPIQLPASLLEPPGFAAKEPVRSE